MPTVLLDPTAFYHLSPWSEKRGPLHDNLQTPWLPMIQGRVNARNEAIVSLRLRGLTGVELEVECLIDTGFDGELVLSVPIALAAGFVFLGPNSATVAGGSSQSYETYLGQFLWNGVFRDCFVACIGDEALIGMDLLNGHELRIEVTPGGMVEISELP